jgi:hypothetical protein
VWLEWELHQVEVQGFRVLVAERRGLQALEMGIQAQGVKRHFSSWGQMPKFQDIALEGIVSWVLARLAKGA